MLTSSLSPADLGDFFKLEDGGGCLSVFVTTFEASATTTSACGRAVAIDNAADGIAVDIVVVVPGDKCGDVVVLPNAVGAP